MREAHFGVGLIYFFVRLHPIGFYIGWFNFGHISIGGGWCE